MVLDLHNDYPTTSEMLSSETVTLTKAQLKAILEAVGQVGGLQIREDTSKPSNQIASCSLEKDFYPVHENHPATQLNSNISLDENTNGFLGVEAGGCRSELSLSSSQNASVSSSNPSPVSKLQQKRTQWERERAEAEQWNPWGRPGAGAPHNKRSPVAVATVSPSTSGDSLKNQSRSYSGCSYMTSASLPSSTCGRRVPDFIKSSIPFGPNCGDVEESDPLEKKRQWLSELEQQREEQRRRRSESDRWGYEEDPDYCQDMTTTTGRHSGMNTPLSTVTSRSRSYHRGQSSVLLDPGKESELQEQRQRALEYRRSIEQQVEERRRQQEEEKERLRKEEEQEELRLEQERERLMLQYQMEQRQIKEKEEREEQKRQMMAAAVQKAREEAEAEKKAKLAQRLNSQAARSPYGTPTRQIQPSRTSTREETVHTLRSVEHGQSSENTSACTSPKRADRSNREHLQQTATVYPIQSSSFPLRDVEHLEELGHHDSNSPVIKTVGEMSSQTEQPVKLPPEPLAYVANRLLTPSVWRSRERKIAAQNAWGHHRDMSTQTEPYFYWEEIYKHQGQLYHSVDDKSSRNSSATSSKRSSAEKAGYKSDSGTRPIWGANQPVKSFVKMTDRDPNQYRRKKFQEMRRQHWEREMAMLREQLALARSRSKSNVTPANAGSNTPAKVGNSSVTVSGPSPRLSRNRVASESGFQVQRRTTSRGHSEKQSERDSAWSSAGSSVYTMSANSLGTTYTISSLENQLPTLSRRWSHSSDHIPPSSRMADSSQTSHSEPYEKLLVADSDQDHSYFPPVRRKWHSHESFQEAMQQQSQQFQELRPHSPSILLHEGSNKGLEEPVLLPPPAPPAPRRKWSEQGNFDPAAVALGNNLGADSDSEKGSPDPPEKFVQSDSSQDPLVNPKVVTSHPTPRQDRILQQLSTLRQGLLQKQREIETLVHHPASWPS